MYTKLQYSANNGDNKNNQDNENHSDNKIEGTC